MNIEEMLEISDCPLCEGGALLEEECGCGYYVMCLECGCHSVTIDFHSEEERLEAAKKAVTLWNTGKVISSSPACSTWCSHTAVFNHRNHFIYFTFSICNHICDRISFCTHS